MIELADTTFRAYRKRNGMIALHLRGYLLVHADLGFRLTRYLRDIRFELKLPGREFHLCEYVAHSDSTVCKYDGRCMLYDLWVSTVIPGDSLRSCVADLKMTYHLSFTGHPTEEPETIERMVPVITRYYTGGR